MEFVPAYIDGKYGLKGIAKKTGLYIIKEDDMIVYIGRTSHCLQKVLYRHFQAWNPDRQSVHRRVTYFDRKNIFQYQVATIVMDDINKISDAERLLILKYLPRDNHKHVITDEQDFPF